MSCLDTASQQQSNHSRGGAYLTVLIAHNAVLLGGHEWQTDGRPAVQASAVMPQLQQLSDGDRREAAASFAMRFAQMLGIDEESEPPDSSSEEEDGEEEAGAASQAAGGR